MKKECRTCKHWGADMICGSGTAAEQGYRTTPTYSCCRAWECIDLDGETAYQILLQSRSRSGGRLAAARDALDRAAEKAREIQAHLSAVRLALPQEDLLEGVQVERKTPTVAELSAREEHLWAAMTAPMHAQELAEKAAQEQTRMTDEAIRRLLEERCPGTPIEAFCSSFIPGGFRRTAPDGTAFDFVYTTHGPSTAGGTTTMTMDLTVTETKTGGEQE